MRGMREQGSILLYETLRERLRSVTGGAEEKIIYYSALITQHALNAPLPLT
jgi:hypothetical protein